MSNENYIDFSSRTHPKPKPTINKPVEEQLWGDGYKYNVYSSPEECGLRIIQVFDMPDLSYEFDTTIIFQHIATGKYYMVHDSGCSCPTPFENVNSLADMTEISEWEALHYEDPYK